MRTAGNIYATASSYPGLTGIAFNRVWGKDAEKLLDSIAGDVTRGYHPPGTGSVQGIMNHELGHTLDALLNLERDPEMIALHERYKDRLEKEVSRYAAKHGIGEFIAECWAEYQTAPSSRTAAEAVGRLVEARYRSRFPG